VILVGSGYVVHDVRGTDGWINSAMTPTVPWQQMQARTLLWSVLEQHTVLADYGELMMMMMTTNITY